MQARRRFHSLAKGRQRLKKKLLGVNFRATASALPARFERDLLGEHDVSDRQIAAGRKHRPMFGRPFSPISQTFAAAPA